MDPVALRLTMELGARRGLTLVPPDEARLRFRTPAGALPALIARELDTLRAEGRLQGRWSLRIAPAGLAQVDYALEADADSAPAATLEGELAVLGEVLMPRLQAAVEDALASDAGVGELTEREVEVFLAFLDGADVATLARTLHLSPHTVRNHLRAVREKLDVPSQKELRARYAG